ncbi:Nudix hydrolase 20, chloroplastic [Anthophora retusa]
MTDSDKKPMSRLLKLANRFNCFYLSGFHSGECRAFVVDGQQVGLVRPDVMKELLNYPQVFQVHPEYVQLNPAFRDYAERSAKVEEVLREWRAGGKFVTLRGWREECYEIRAQFNTPPLFKMDRSATCLFGVRKYGVDINGYVMDPVKGLSIWLQKRSPNKQTWPGYWDNMNLYMTLSYRQISYRAITTERHGYITAENEPNFIEIVELLHVPLQTIYNQPQKKCKLAANGEAIETLDRI